MLQRQIGRIGTWLSAALSGEERVRLMLLTALLGLSWWSTTQGLLALITAGSGEPSTLVAVTIGFAVAVLTVLISWTVTMLHEGRTGIWAPGFVAGYFLLTAISVGFGFGFYWTHIESRSAARMAASEETDAISRRLGTIYATLSDSTDALEALAVLSQERAETEAESGGTCGAGVAGPGPRYRLRIEDAARMAALKERIAAQLGTQGNASAAKTVLGRRAEIEARIAALAPEQFATLGESQARALLTDTQRSVSAAIDRYNAFRTGSAVQGTVSYLEQRIAAGRGVMTDGEAGFTCPDPGLEVLMMEAADTLRALPAIEPVELNVPLGAEATVSAFAKLGRTVLSPLGMQGSKLGARDVVPLLVALAVDLFILLISVSGRKPPGARDPRAVAAWLETPDSLRRLVGRSGESALPTHAEMLEHTFWWRGAYHLALPVESPGEAPLSGAQRGLTLSAMVLADAGLLVPVRRAISDRTIKNRLAARFGRSRSWPVRRAYDLYKFERNGLARMTSLLMPHADPEPHGDEPSKQPAVEKSGSSLNWRSGLMPAPKPKHDSRMMVRRKGNK